MHRKKKVRKILRTFFFVFRRFSVVYFLLNVLCASDVFCLLVSLICEKILTTENLQKNIFGLKYLYVGGQALGFVAHFVKVAVQRSIAYNNAHAAVDTSGGFSENAEVGIFFAGAFESSILRLLFAGNV
jgi:hypothetical protein